MVNWADWTSFAIFAFAMDNAENTIIPAGAVMNGGESAGERVWGVETHKLMYLTYIYPLGIPGGRYVLSFRYDAEQTPQVWNTCASIKIV
jgi:hypothetical protein